MNPENNTPMQPIVPTEEKALGPAIGVIIIILVLVLGGLYFWGERMNKGAAVVTPQATEEPKPQDAEMQKLQQQSSSDEVGSIEADLQATDVSKLGTETAEINAAASSSAGN